MYILYIYIYYKDYFIIYNRPQKFFDNIKKRLDKAKSMCYTMGTLNERGMKNERFKNGCK